MDRGGVREEPILSGGKTGRSDTTWGKFSPHTASGIVFFSGKKDVWGSDTMWVLKTDSYCYYRIGKIRLREEEKMTINARLPWEKREYR